MKDNFIFEHLHTHSHFSLLDGLSSITQLVERAFEMDRTSVCVTDHGSIGGIPELFRTTKEYGLKPIAGMEAYFCEDVKEEIVDKKRGYNHLVLLAKNLNGYKNLCKLVTRSNREGFYKKPRVDYSMLNDHKDGLIALSACIGGLPQEAIIKGNPAKASKSIDKFIQIFGKEHYILEMQDTNIPEQKIVNMAFEQYGRKGLKICATVDSHYTYCEDAVAHDALLCIGTHGKIDDPKRFKFNGSGYHYKHPSEMYDLFNAKYLLETRKIADMCELYAIPKTGCMPEIKIPEGHTDDSWLSHLAYNGLKKRKLERSTNHVSRLQKELEVVRNLQFASYFLMVQDIIAYARKSGIIVGPGRGSSAGSLLAFCLYITQVDPLRYGLYFERFLNKDRIAPPDIDIDISDSGRQQVLAYVRETYGEDFVAHIGSYSTLGPRQAIRDVISAHGWSEEKQRSLLKQIPDDPMLKFEDIKAMSVVKNMVGDDMLKIISSIAGKNRHNSTHAAGLIVNGRKLVDDIPLIKTKDGMSQTMYSYDELSKLGYIKFDILGLTTLGIIDRVLKNAEVDQDKMWALNDPDTYELLSNGETIGVFQLEGRGYQMFIKQYKPRNFEDLMMVNALYRPGPMQGGEGLDIILKRRAGKEKAEYIDEGLEPILKWTYGMPVYQEQIMQICVALAGFTLSKADSMRSAIGKKKEAEIAGLKDEFIEGCVKRGRRFEIAQQLYADIEFFARYGWNKAHAAAYGMVTYATAYLKKHHTANFMAEIMNSSHGNPDKMNLLIFESRRLGLKFEKPHINTSDINYKVSSYDVIAGKSSIKSGFSSIKGVGEKASQAIIEERNTHGAYQNIDDFRARIPRKILNSRIFKFLEDSGTFAGLSQHEEEVPF